MLDSITSGHTSRTYLLRFRCEREVRRHFYHNLAVHGHLCRVLVHPLPSVNDKPLPPWVVVPHVVESGRIRYSAGDGYNIGVTFFGSGFPDANGLFLRISDAENSRQAKPLGSEVANLSIQGAEECSLASRGNDVRELHSLGRVTLLFTSPLLIEQKIPGSDARIFDPGYFDAPHFFRMLYRRLFDLAKLSRQDTPRFVLPALPDVSVEQNRLMWVKIPPVGRKPDAPEYHGVVGKVVIRGHIGDWAECLINGREAHVGKHTGIGFGGYEIMELAPRSDLRRARSILLSITEPHNLADAFQSVKGNDGAAGSDFVTIEDFESYLDDKVSFLASELTSGTYTPTEMRGVVAEMGNGKLRALAIPSVADRVAQRATVQFIAPAIDKLLEDCSYAYRAGFSRLDAAGAIARARADGYRYVLRADIENFFDQVDWDLLSDKLDAIYPYDRELVDLLRRWAALPVSYRGRLIVRSGGLPQGASISPVLANLFLDHFDEIMQTENLRFVRYADDFVVLARSQRELDAARERAEEHLASLHLRLNLKKTQVTDFDQGFRYLGYLFLRASVLDSPASDESPTGESPLLHHDIPTCGWLAQAASQEAATIESLSVDVPSRVRGLEESEDSESSNVDRMPLYIDSQDVRVSVSRGAIKISRVDNGQELVSVAVDRLSHVFVIGRPRMSLPAALAASSGDAPVYFADRRGELTAVIEPRPPDWRLWLAQARMLERPDDLLAISRWIVEAKLNNQAVTLRERRDDAVTEQVESIRALIHSVRHQDNVESVRGIEGRGAAVYFGAWKNLIGPQWNFQGRAKRPAPDPINAMLSFGYTLLYCRCSTALQAVGLNPHLGMFHLPTPRFHALAADLQEEFRHLVDGLVFKLVRKGEVRPDEFVYPEGRPGCWMLGPLRKRFIAEFEERLQTAKAPTTTTVPVHYREAIWRQSTSLGRYVRGQIMAYIPIRLR